MYVAHGRVDVPRYRDIDQQQLPAVSLSPDDFRLIAGEDRMWARRRADYNVRFYKMLPTFFERIGCSTKLLRQLLRIFQRAIDHSHIGRAIFLQIAGRELAHFAGAHQQDLALVERAKDLLRQFYGRIRNRNGALANRSLIANAFRY